MRKFIYEIISKHKISVKNYEGILEANPPQLDGLNDISDFYQNKKLTSFLNSFKTIPVIAEELGVSASLLTIWKKRGEFVNVEFYGCVYDSIEISRIFQLVYNPLYTNFKHGTKIEHLLSKDIINYIESYLSYRSKGNKISLNGENKYKGFSVKRIDVHRRRLMLAFMHLTEFHITKRLNYDIPCIWIERINNPQSKNRFLRVLSEEEIRIFTDNPYNIELLGIEDFMFLQDKYQPATFEGIALVQLKPFFCYYFMLLEDRKSAAANPEEIWDIQELIKEQRFNKMKTRILSVINSTPTVRINKQERYAKKVFSTREQYVRVYLRVLLRYGLEKALILVFWTELGLRRSESALIAVEDFWIDDDGYLKQDKDGYGKCMFPEAKSKATGADEFPLSIIPSTVKDINHYLKLMYEICPFENHKKFAGKTFVGNNITKTYEDGHGFFFRRVRNNPDNHFTSVGIQYFITQLKKEDPLEFYSLKQRKSFTPHDGRHTLNNWIEKTQVTNINLVKYLMATANMQMRHAPDRHTSESYREVTDSTIFKQIFECSLNFPKDLEQLRIWEINNSYREPNDTFVTLESGRTVDVKDKIKVGKMETSKAKSIPETTTSTMIAYKAQLEKYQFEIKKIDQELNMKLASRPKGWSGHEWLDARQKLEEEKSDLLKKIKDLDL